MVTGSGDSASMPRRDFLKKSLVTAGSLGAVGAAGTPEAEAASGTSLAGASAWAAKGAVAANGLKGTAMTAGKQNRPYNGPYTGEHLSRVAFPMGGMGAGMICLEGTGALSHVSLRNQPAVFNEPCMFAAICAKGVGEDGANVARVVEGPVPTWKLFGQPDSGNGAGAHDYGLPRYHETVFNTRFPFGMIELTDPKLPLKAMITGWSPFEPNDDDNASLPVAGLEYEFTNTADKPVEAVFSFNSKNFMSVGGDTHAVKEAPGGFVLWESGPEGEPWKQGGFCVRTTDPAAKVNYLWFRGGWFDSLTMAWKDVQDGACYDRAAVPEKAEGGASPGATLFVPFTLKPGQTKKIVVQLSWYAGETDLRRGHETEADEKKKEEGARLPTYRPWYATRFAGIDEVSRYWAEKYDALRANSLRFSQCFYDTTLPAEVVEAVAANLTIIKSCTVLRQSDGKLWCWEGCCDGAGCCYGSCTHVWNYAQAIPHLFPALERSLRETEFEVSQLDDGYQAFRVALPIRQPAERFHAAADGQLGGIMKVYREWTISADTEWLRGMWPKVKASLDYCINTWDPDRKGYLEEPQHNTYDIEFWGPNGMLTSFYLGALEAALAMGRALEIDTGDYWEILHKGKEYADKELYNGEYYIQKIQWKNLKAADPTKIESFAGTYSPEALELLQKEGPKYQYGDGCLSDGVLGSWMALVCGVGQVMDRDQVASHLKAVHKYNLKRDLMEHANPQRPSFAAGEDGGLLLCTWPRGGALSLPFVYSNEVWTGIEYQVASHLMLLGLVDEGLDIVRACRDRYDGRIRNPFNEYECGHWYARAMASYGLLQGLTGVRYNAVEKKLYIEPSIAGDFRSFLSTATGYGTVGVKDGKPFVDVQAGTIEVADIRFVPKQA